MNTIVQDKEIIDQMLFESPQEIIDFLDTIFDESSIVAFFEKDSHIASFLLIDIRDNFVVSLLRAYGIYAYNHYVLVGNDLISSELVAFYIGKLFTSLDIPISLVGGQALILICYKFITGDYDMGLNNFTLLINISSMLNSSMDDMERVIRYAIHQSRLYDFLGDDYSVLSTIYLLLIIIHRLIIVKNNINTHA